MCSGIGHDAEYLKIVMIDLSTDYRYSIPDSFDIPDKVYIKLVISYFKIVIKYYLLLLLVYGVY